MLIFKTRSGSLHPRMPPAGSTSGFLNVAARTNAEQLESPIRIANRIPVANILLAALPHKDCQHLLDFSALRRATMGTTELIVAASSSLLLAVAARLSWSIFRNFFLRSVLNEVV